MFTRQMSPILETRDESWEDAKNEIVAMIEQSVGEVLEVK